MTVPKGMQVPEGVQVRENMQAPGGVQAREGMQAPGGVQAPGDKGPVRLTPTKAADRRQTALPAAIPYTVRMASGGRNLLCSAALSSCNVQMLAGSAAGCARAAAAGSNTAAASATAAVKVRSCISGNSVGQLDAVYPPNSPWVSVRRDAAS